MEHSAWLKDCCRVCGGRLNKYKVSYDCHKDKNKQILLAIEVSVENDKKEIHPQRFCHACYNTCTRASKAATKGEHYTTKLEKFVWVAHEEGCPVCSHFEGVKRGRKPKKTSTGRPSYMVQDLVCALKQKSPPSMFSDEQLRRRISEVENDLLCPLCSMVVDRPLLLTTCSKIVCMNCCVTYIYQHPDLSCPCCGPAHVLDNSTVIPAPPVILKLLKSIQITCERCNEKVPAGKYITYTVYTLSNGISTELFRAHTCKERPTGLSLDEVIAKPPNTPLSHQEDRLATSLLRRKMAQESDGFLRFKTGGQVRSEELLTCDSIAPSI